MIKSPPFARVLSLKRRCTTCLLVGFLVFGFALAGSVGATSRAGSAGISARVTKASFIASEAGSVRLIYRFSRPSKSFSYRLAFKNGSKWQPVRSVKKKGIFKGSKTTTIKKLFAGRTIEVGRYRLRLSAGTGSELLGFRVVNAGVISISAGAFHTCAVLNDGTIKCWGDDGYGQLGNGSTPTGKPTAVSTPVQVRGISNATQVSSGGYYTCALLSDHTIKCWGDNGDGQLGDGTTTGRSTPVRVKGISNAVQISAGVFHTCAVLSDHTIKCWGDNTSGQLGAGLATGSTTPIEEIGVTNARTVSAGKTHTCAVLFDHTIACWGGNGVGALGDGSTTSGPNSVKVKGIVNATAVSAGDDHTCAVLSDGTVKCWGGVNPCENELAWCWPPATTTWSTTPLQVGEISSATQLSNPSYTCVRESDGTLWCWGWNENSGQPTAPVEVEGISNAAQVSSGRCHVCALLSDSAVKCWGSGEAGQLGNGETSSSSVPVSVIGFP